MATIEPTPEYVAHLLSMTHSPNELRSKGFVLQPLSPAELLKKARCDKCNKRPPKSKPWKRKAFTESSSQKDSMAAIVPVANKLAKREDEDFPGTVKGMAASKTSASSSTAYQATNDNNNSLNAPGHRNTASRHSAIAELPRGQRIKGKCFNCNCVGHRAVDCPEEQQNLPKPTCQWHPGARSETSMGQIYLCCRAHISTPGCHSAPTHSLPTTLTPPLTTRYQVHPTPIHPSPPSSSSTSSSSSPSPPKALAVAIDCEMGTSHDGESELIRVTLLDYFSGAALLDALVWPDVPMQHFNTRYSGVTATQMRAAKSNHTCLFGVEAARRQVWRYVDAETVVVGHDVKNDLGALRWAHGRVVDTLLVEKAARNKADQGGFEKEKEDREGEGARADRSASQGAEEPKWPGLNLKDVSKLRLGRIIQKRAHDSFEDALASRDIVHHHATKSMG